LVAQLIQFHEGDEVIIPAHTYTASAFPFLRNGAKIVWADIDIETRVIDLNTIKDKVSEKTKAIVVVHLYGFGADMLPIIEYAKTNNIKVIEDAAQALGVMINGQMAGTFGDFGVYSFHSHKNLTTLGEGGMLYVKDDDIAEIVPMLRHNGHCEFNFEKNLYWKPAMSNVDAPSLNGELIMPQNYSITEVQCAIGSVLLDRIDDINKEKRERAIEFIDGLKDFSFLKFHRVNSNRHNYHLLAAQFENNLRDEFIQLMSEKKRIQCVVQYYPLYRYDLYKKYNCSENHCPNTDQFFDNMVSFPFHHSLNSQEIEYIFESTIEVLNTFK